MVEKNVREKIEEEFRKVKEKIDKIIENYIINNRLSISMRLIYMDLWEEGEVINLCIYVRNPEKDESELIAMYTVKDDPLHEKKPNAPSDIVTKNVIEVLQYYHYPSKIVGEARKLRKRYDEITTEIEGEEIDQLKRALLLTALDASAITPLIDALSYLAARKAYKQITSYE